LSKSTWVTTRQIEAIVRKINVVYEVRLARDRSRVEQWRASRDEAVKQLHALLRPAARPYAGRVLTGLAVDWLVEMADVYDAAHVRGAHSAEVQPASATLEKLTEENGRLGAELAALHEQHERVKTEMKTLQEQLLRSQASAVRKSTATSVVLPAQRISVDSPIQREILRLMALEGLGRVWRMAQRLSGNGTAGNANSIRNAVARLAERGLVDDYRQHGKPVSWAVKAGGARRLVVLTDAGCSWCRATLGQEPMESEIAVAARRHKSVSHGVAVLETAAHLRDAGYTVDDDPQAILMTAERWGPRCEPDLMASRDGQTWPIEVQRETSDRLLDKWRKTLHMTHRLALVSYNEIARQHQARILRNSAAQLPAGVIRLASLEAMENGRWTWDEITTHGRSD
jgi:hypothetical protein